MDRVNILGIDIDNTTLQDAKEKVVEYLKEGGFHSIYTPNSEIVMDASKDEKFKEALNKGSLVIPDGIGLVYASKIKRKPLKERVTGYDLSVEMLELASRYGYKVYFLGCEEGVAEEAKNEIEKLYPEINIVGTHSGFFKGYHIGYENDPEEKAIIDEINEKETDILFVGLGAPKQEYWIEHHKDNLNVKVAIGNGGTMNVISGKLKRAPEFFQRTGFEWLYRLIKEPKRITRQIKLPIFLLTILLKKDSVK